MLYIYANTLAKKDGYDLNEKQLWTEFQRLTQEALETKITTNLLLLLSKIKIKQIEIQLIYLYNNVKEPAELTAHMNQTMYHISMLTEESIGAMYDVSSDFTTILQVNIIKRLIGKQYAKHIGVINSFNIFDIVNKEIESLKKLNNESKEIYEPRTN